MKPMQEVRVVPRRQEAEPDAFREAVVASFRGDARPRPRDCSGARYLVREAVRPDFEALAARHGLGVEVDPLARRVEAY